MKKLTLTLAIVLGLGFGAMAQDAGLFQRGEEAAPTRLGGLPGFPGHGENGNQPAPVGSGVAVLVGLGAAYLLGKKREE